MKQKIILTVLYLSTLWLYTIAQDPGFNYQAVLRDSEGAPMPNATVTLTIFLTDGPEGAVLYRESQSLTTNALGMLNTTVGSGSVEAGQFVDIIGVQNLNLKLEADIPGEPDIVDFGYSPISSTPYALYGEDADADPENEMQSLSLEGDSLRISGMTGVNLKNLASPWSTENGGLSYKLTLADANNQRDNNLDDGPTVEIEVDDKGGVKRTITKKDGSKIIEIVTTNEYDELDENIQTAINFLLTKSEKIPKSLTTMTFESTETIIKGETIKSLHTTKVGDQKTEIEQTTGGNKINIKVIKEDKTQLSGKVILHEGKPYSHKVECPDPPMENALLDSEEGLMNDGEVVWQENVTVNNSGNTSKTTFFGNRQEYRVKYDLILDDEISTFIGSSHLSGLLKDLIDDQENCEGENVLFQRKSFSGQTGMTSGVAINELTNYCGGDMSGPNINFMGRYLTYSPSEEMNCIDFTKWTKESFRQGLTNGEINVYDFGADFENDASFLNMGTLDGEFRAGLLATKEGGIIGLADGNSDLNLSLGYNPGNMPVIGMAYQSNSTHLITINNESAAHIGLNGPNSTSNIQLGTFKDSPDNGAISVHDDQGEAKGFFYVNTFGQSVLQVDVKNFITDHPIKQSKNIVYASLEGPEAAAYNRGTSTLSNGEAEVTFEEHFQHVADPHSMTIVLTPLSASSEGLAVIEKSETGFIIAELHQGTGNYQFDWEVKCKRKGFEDYQVIREKGRMVSAKSDPIEVQQLLINPN